jgi:NAD(P)-dependent dehydrogenase (short-subunit alcohol dehydrogenase family)
MLMTPRHQGKMAVITGAASGIGRAFAARLASEGAHVVVADRANADETLAEIQSFGGKASSIACDISLERDVEQLGHHVEAEAGGCDILVNNAGLIPSCQLEELTFAEWRRIMATNLDAMFLTCKRFVPRMRAKRWGRIINMTSNTYGQVTKGLTHYIASKAGVIGFTRALASEVGVDGITVNAIGPGFTRTPGTLALGSGYRGMSSEELFDVLAQRQAIPRAPTTADLVGTLSFLASDDAAFITAQTIYVDGGLVRGG